MQEIWKSIQNSCHEVSNLGRVKNAQTNLIRSLYTSADGYLGITFNTNGASKGFRVHRLVALAFIPNPENYPYVNHIDGNRKNNRVENLEWCNQSMNVLHAINTGLGSYSRNGTGNGNSKLTGADVQAIRELANKKSGASLARQYKVSASTICRIIKNELWPS